MSNEPYLWDRSGPVDPFVAKLERLLQPKRAQLAAASRRRRPRLLGVAVFVLAAAAVVAWICLDSGERDAAVHRATTPPVAAEQPAEAPAAAPTTQAKAPPEPAADMAGLRSR